MIIVVSRYFNNLLDIFDSYYILLSIFGSYNNLVDIFNYVQCSYFFTAKFGDGIKILGWKQSVRSLNIIVLLYFLQHNVFYS